MNDGEREREERKRERNEEKNKKREINDAREARKDTERKEILNLKIIGNEVKENKSVL